SHFVWATNHHAAAVRATGGSHARSCWAWHASQPLSGWASSQRRAVKERRQLHALRRAWGGPWGPFAASTSSRPHYGVVAPPVRGWVSGRRPRSSHAAPRSRRATAHVPWGAPVPAATAAAAAPGRAPHGGPGPAAPAAAGAAVLSGAAAGAGPR